jgi:hypothetical protein
LNILYHFQAPINRRWMSCKAIALRGIAVHLAATSTVL